MPCHVLHVSLVLQDDPLGKIRRVELTPPADTRPVFVVRKLLDRNKNARALCILDEG